MVNYTEEQLFLALAEMQNGQPVAKVAREWAIPRSTLNNRKNGQQPRTVAFQELQKLSRPLEDSLAEWVRNQGAIGLPPIHSQIKKLAHRMLRTQGNTTTIGKRWINRFIDRHPFLKTQRSKSMEHTQVNGATIDVIRGWFPYLNVPAIKAIKPTNRYNMDEAGIMEGQGTNGLVVGTREKKAILKKAPGTRVWTSFIECVSATGRRLNPLVIFKGKSVQQQWFPLDLKPFKDWQFTATDNGWTNNAVAVEWLEKIFIPETQPDDPSEYRLLILDGHGSHTSDDFMWLCFKNRIHVIYLPAHCSHVVQSLDIGVFSSLKTAYRRWLAGISLWTDSTIVGKRNFLEYYRRARLVGLTSSNILAGWKGSGLWPVNQTKPLMSRLLVENRRPTTPPLPTTRPAPGTVISGPNVTKQVVGPLELELWSTPKKSVELHQQLVDFNKQTGASRTQRQLFNKVKKAFDLLDSNLAIKEAENQALRAQLEAVKPRKRKRVDTNPNELFANIAAVRRAQVAAGAVEGSQVDSSEDGNSSDGNSCIVVATNSRR
jgi:4-hydroxybenzoate polyprenyltransferase